MKKDLDPKIKWMLLGGAILYVYFFVMKKNGGTLSGNSEGWKIRIDPKKAYEMFSPHLPDGLRRGIKHGLNLGSHYLNERYGVESEKIT